MLFSSPIWFTAFAALLVPVAIHLWNTRRGKTLRIGSIAWLQTGNKQNRRSLRLTELLLLLLRCLLLFLLVLLLTRPFWQQKTPLKTVKGWVMMEPATLKQAYFAHKKTVDSLLKSGFEFHAFSPGFANTDFKEALKKPLKRSGKISNYWSMLKRLNVQIPAGLPVYLITENPLKSFVSQRPQLDLNLHWLTFQSADSTYRNPEKAWRRPDGSVQTAIFDSRPGGSFYQFSADKKDAAGLQVDSSTLRISIFADEKQDAQYLRAALSAIQNFSGRRITLATFTTLPTSSTFPTSPTSPTWLFWLSQKTLPKTAQAENIFRYASGKIMASSSNFRLSSSAENISVYQKIIPAKKGAIIWSDDSGEPVLQRLQLFQQTQYELYTHLNPTWSSLVWHPDFAASLLNILYPTEKNRNKNDRRIIDQQQIMPEKTAQQKVKQANFITQKKDLKTLLWAALIVTFLFERLFSHYKRKALAA